MTTCLPPHDDRSRGSGLRSPVVLRPPSPMTADRRPKTTERMRAEHVTGTLQRQQRQAVTASPCIIAHFSAPTCGPVVRDRIHFFTAAERTKNHLYKSVIVQLPQYY